MATLTRKRIDLACLRALAVAALLAGCGGRQVLSKTIEITPVDLTGTTINAMVGDTIIVTLKANPTTGYAWQFTAGATFAIISSNYVADPSAAGVSGAGGKQLVTLEVTKVGSSDLTGTYRQPWIPLLPGAKPDLSITVQAKSP